MTKSRLVWSQSSVLCMQICVLMINDRCPEVEDPITKEVEIAT